MDTALRAADAATPAALAKVPMGDRLSAAVVAMAAPVLAWDTMSSMFITLRTEPPELAALAPPPTEMETPPPAPPPMALIAAEYAAIAMAAASCAARSTLERMPSIKPSTRTDAALTQSCFCPMMLLAPADTRDTAALVTFP